jgi:hypothetical protein
MVLENIEQQEIPALKRQQNSELIAIHQKWHKELDKFEKEKRESFEQLIIESYLNLVGSDGVTVSFNEDLGVKAQGATNILNSSDKTSFVDDTAIGNQVQSESSSGIPNGELPIPDNENMDNVDSYFGPIQKKRIQNIVDMGFSRNDVIAALEMKQNDVVGNLINLGTSCLGIIRES